MQQKKQPGKESRQHRGERIQEIPGNAQIDQPDHATTRPNLAPHLEVFAKAVAEGHSHVEAAEMCGRARGSASDLYTRPGVQERIAELRTIVRNANDKAISENATMGLRAITINQNDIIMGLADIARDLLVNARVRVSAYQCLADIFMLRAKNIRDIGEFYGWTADELLTFATTGVEPPRFQHLFKDGQVAGFGPAASLRTAKN